LLVYVRLNVFSDKSFTFSLKQFQLRDLVSAFDLDLLWLQLFSKLSKKSSFTELKNDKLSEDFCLAVYKSFLVFFLNDEEKLPNKDQIFVKSFFTYLKSHQ